MVQLRWKLSRHLIHIGWTQSAWNVMRSTCGPRTETNKLKLKQTKSEHLVTTRLLQETLEEASRRPQKPKNMERLRVAKEKERLCHSRQFEKVEPKHNPTNWKVSKVVNVLID